MLKRRGSSSFGGRGETSPSLISSTNESLDAGAARPQRLVQPWQRQRIAFSEDNDRPQLAAGDETSLQRLEASQPRPISPRAMLAPAPRKPMPDTTCAAIREGSSPTPGAVTSTKP